MKKGAGPAESDASCTQVPDPPLIALLLGAHEASAESLAATYTSPTRTQPTNSIIINFD